MESREISCPIIDMNSEELSKMVVTLPIVLKFVTWSTSVPEIGFYPSPSITFEDDTTGRKLHVLTCSNTLCLPVPVNNILLNYDCSKIEFTSCELLNLQILEMSDSTSNSFQHWNECNIVLHLYS